MPSITFDLETVTPLFLAGADQTTAELRPPAFRGALRYWFRAIAAGITSGNKVKEWENKVFGNTDAGGSVVIRIQANKAISNSILKKDQEFPGLIYLFFSAYGDNKREPRGCFPPGSHFKLILQTRLNRVEDQQCLSLAAGALWMFTMLGGIGSRSNRGGGNLKVIKEPKDLGLDLLFCSQALNLDQASTEISTGIQKIQGLYTSILGSSNVTLMSSGQSDVIHKDTSDLWLWQSETIDNNDYWDTLLDSFGDKYSSFRLRYKNAAEDDYFEIKELLRTNGKSSIATIKRAAFGLPIQFRFKSLQGKTAFVEATGKINRSSSCLHIKVNELANKKLAILLIHFKTQLLPINRKLLIKSKSFTKAIECEVPNQDILSKEFIPSLAAIAVNIS